MTWNSRRISGWTFESWRNTNFVCLFVCCLEPSSSEEKTRTRGRSWGQICSRLTPRQFPTMPRCVQVTLMFTPATAGTNCKQEVRISWERCSFLFLKGVSVSKISPEPMERLETKLGVKTSQDGRRRRSRTQHSEYEFMTTFRFHHSLLVSGLLAVAAILNWMISKRSAAFLWEKHDLPFCCQNRKGGSFVKL